MVRHAFALSRLTPLPPRAPQRPPQRPSSLPSPATSMTSVTMSGCWARRWRGRQTCTSPRSGARRLCLARASSLTSQGERSYSTTGDGSGLLVPSPLLLASYFHTPFPTGHGGVCSYSTMGEGSGLLVPSPLLLPSRFHLLTHALPYRPGEMQVAVIWLCSGLLCPFYPCVPSSCFPLLDPTSPTHPFLLPSTSLVPGSALQLPAPLHPVAAKAPQAPPQATSD